MKCCPYCGMTKVTMLDDILKKIGHKEGKSKYTDGNITKEEMIIIYDYVINGRCKSD